TRDFARAGNARGMANVFRNNPAPYSRRDRRWQSRKVSLDQNVDLLLALPRHRRFVVHILVALLVATAHVGYELANHFVDHAAGCGHAWMDTWWRKIPTLVVVWRSRRPRRCLDDFSSNQRSSNRRNRSRSA